MSSFDAQVQDGLLTVSRADESAQVRLALQGELDISNASIVEASLEGAIDSEKKVLIDLARLEFLDSTGLALIVRTLPAPRRRTVQLPAEPLEGGPAPPRDHRAGRADGDRLDRAAAEPATA